MSDPRRGPTSDSRLRYAVDETPSEGLTLGLSVQVATVILTGIILIPIIVLNAADYPEGLEWAVFAALVVSGLATILQARPAGPFGAGYALYMGTWATCSRASPARCPTPPTRPASPSPT